MKLKDLIMTISSATNEAIDNAFDYVGINAEKLSKAQAYHFQTYLWPIFSIDIETPSMIDSAHLSARHW